MRCWRKASIDHPQAARTAFRFASPLKGAQSLAGETPATAAAGAACSAAFGIFLHGALPALLDDLNDIGLWRLRDKRQQL